MFYTLKKAFGPAFYWVLGLRLRKYKSESKLCRQNNCFVPARYVRNHPSLHTFHAKQDLAQVGTKNTKS